MQAKRLFTIPPRARPLPSRSGVWKTGCHSRFGRSLALPRLRKVIQTALLDRVLGVLEQVDRLAVSGIMISTGGARPCDAG